MKIVLIGSGAIGTPQKKYILEKTFNELLIVDQDDRRANSTLENAGKYGEVFIISIPSNGKPTGELDTQAITDIVRFLAISQTKGEPRIVIIRSTVPVGFTRELSKSAPKLKLFFVPEFLTEKTAEKDFMENDRLIVGVDEKSVENEMAVQTFANFFPINGRINLCLYEAAELLKMATNSFYALKVTFFNELNKFCGNRGINYSTLQNLMAMDPRIGSSPNDSQGADVHLRIAQDGNPGFGGKCLPKDLAQLAKHYRDARASLGLLETIAAINQKLRALPDQKNIKKTENKNTKTKTTNTAPEPGARA